MTIKIIKTERDEWAEKAINSCTEAVEHAKEIPQQSVIIVMLGRDGNINTLYSAIGRLELIGALEYAKVQIAQEFDK